jgi:hypothetical protein
MRTLCRSSTSIDCMVSSRARIIHVLLSACDELAGPIHAGLKK